MSGRCISLAHARSPLHCGLYIHIFWFTRSTNAYKTEAHIKLKPKLILHLRASSCCFWVCVLHVLDFGVAECVVPRKVNCVQIMKPVQILTRPNLFIAVSKFLSCCSVCHAHRMMTFSPSVLQLINDIFSCQGTSVLLPQAHADMDARGSRTDDAHVADLRGCS